MAQENYAEIFKALGHQIRLSIACGILKRGRCNVNTMSERLHVSQSLISQHVNILKKAGIIEGKREGNIIWYEICSETTKKVLQNINLNVCNCNQ